MRDIKKKSKVPGKLDKTKKPTVKKNKIKLSKMIVDNKEVEL